MARKRDKKTRDLAQNLGLLSRNRSSSRPRSPYGLCSRNRSGQEEIVGFAVIMIIVAVIFVVIIGFLLTSRDSDTDTVQNYEISSFLSASLQYTTECEDYIEFLSLKDLISACEEKDTCLNGQDSCVVLNETISEMMKNSWDVGSQSAIKGYSLNIIVDGEERLLFEEGNKTGSYKGGWQDFPKSGREYQVDLTVYYA